jgi:hypothetical protein
VFDRSIRCQPFIAESIEAFNLRRSFLAHLLAKRCTIGGASEAGAWTNQKPGSALPRGASKEPRQ